MVTSAVSAESFEADRKMLWGLCYRMTGCAADADDLVQETFVRALEDPPEDLERPLSPWLVRVAMNLSRDCLRRRRRRGYVGPWLPSPVPTEEAQVLPSYEPRQSSDANPMARYEMLESISFAFLLALEALSPSQRAVLLLREVFDYSTAEAAAALAITESSLKVLLHRGRRKMQEYDKSPAGLTALKSENTRKALEQFLLYFQEHNIEGLERLLKEDAVLVSDGGGEVLAARNVISGRQNVLKLIFGLAKKVSGKVRVSFKLFNGLPALLIEGPQSDPNFATRYTLHCEVNDSACIEKLNMVVAPSKLTSV
jgi:RNA polymerase sigma factor (sigma-70 family)